jgi:hypothetical protein
MSPEKEMHPQPQADVEDESRLKAKPQPGTRTGAPRGDGRRNEDQLRKNQEQLGVSRDHKTPEMKKRHRGTFP